MESLRGLALQGKGASLKKQHAWFVVSRVQSKLMAALLFVTIGVHSLKLVEARITKLLPSLSLRWSRKTPHAGAEAFKMMALVPRLACAATTSPTLALFAGVPRLGTADI
jgi:hypothetical protein